MQGTQGQLIRIPYAESYLHSFAHGISGDAETIVGHMGETQLDRKSFYWTRSGGVTLLPRPAPWTCVQAAACSFDGSVIVGQLQEEPAGNYAAFRWTSGGGVVNILGTTYTGSSVATAVSGDGTKVVGYRNDAGGTIPNSAYLWIDGTGLIDLEEPPDIFANQSYPACVSPDGSLIGGAYNRFVGGVQTFPPVIWDGTDGSVIDVLTLPVGWTLASILAFSDDNTKAAGARHLTNAGSQFSVSLSRYAKTITGNFAKNAASVFTWSGGSTITPITIPDTSEVQFNGRMSFDGSNLFEFHREASALFAAANGLVYSLTILNLAETKPQAASLSMIARV